MADCIRKTANLFDYVLYFNSVFTPYNQFFEYSSIQLLPNTTYTLSTSIAEYGTNPRNTAFIVTTTNQTPTTAGGGLSNISPVTITTENDGILKLYKRISGGNIRPTKEMFDNGDWLMLNTGTTPIPYEPYGWLHSLRKLTTATDTLTTLPVDIYADGNTATVGLKGNTVQNGTGTPDNPIMPQGTGEMTANLFDKDNYNIVYGYFISEGTTTITAESSNNIVYIPCKPNTTYTVSKILSKRFGIGYTIDKPAAGVTVYGAVINYTATSLTVTTDSSAKYLVVYIRNGNSAGETSLSDIVNSLQITEGSTARPYEPYGYKLTISSANTTTPVYFGEVQTERKIKKLVLTGEENITLGGGSAPLLLNISSPAQLESDIVVIISSHYKGVSTSSSWASYDYLITIGNNASVIRIRDIQYNNDINGFKTYLAAQYAAGTPVIIWYVLAEPETAVVNEPLMKIGEYADTVSGITIPTITGKDTFDVETTLKPSEVSLSYTGWHDAEVKEWDGSDWQ